MTAEQAGVEPATVYWFPVRRANHYIAKPVAYITG